MPIDKIITRFAPSPTGYLHLGGARTALFNYLFARQQGGKFILRIEDTDTERNREEYTTSITEGLRWLGLTWDASFKQSERSAIYRQWLEQLVVSDAAYQPLGEEVIRFKNPQRRVAFVDELRGSIEVDVSDLGDFVIAKNWTTPLYNLAVVIDDWQMGVTHVIRGDDGLANTPRQIILQEALGAPRPTYVHLPLILAPDRSKLSKRHGAVAVLEYERLGYLPAALINFLVLLGWHPSDEQEIFSLTELMTKFQLSRIQAGGAVFDAAKLNWLNRQHLKRQPPADLLRLVKARWPDQTVTEAKLARIVPLIVERIDKLSDIESLVAAEEWSYFFQPPQYDLSLLKTPTRLEQVKALLMAVPEPDFTVDAVKQAVWEYATAVGRGEVLWPLRVALTGREKSPDPFIVAAILGKVETLARLDYALAKS